MNKTIAVLIAILMLFAFYACSKTETTEEETSSVSQAETTAVAGMETDAEESTVDVAAGDTAESAYSGNGGALDAGSSPNAATATVDDFMGTWHYTDTEINATWTMAHEGDTIHVTLSGTYEGGEEESSAADCTYTCNNGVLELYSEEYEGGKLTLVFTGNNELKATVNMDGATPITMRR